MFQVSEVTETIEDLHPQSAILKALLLVVIVSIAVAVNFGARTGLRVLLRRSVRRSTEGNGRWTIRVPRSHDGPHGDQRRVQRADATAFMLARLSTLIIIVIALLAISHVLEVNPVVLVSSAGFLGAGVAIGGQSLIKDWLTGLLVLLDDRYAVGDLATIRVNGIEVTGTVEVLNSASVRLRLSDGSAWHTGHGSVEAVTNLSQKLVVNEIQVSPDVWAQFDETLVGPALNAASHDLGLTDIVLLPDLAAAAGGNDKPSVKVLASRQLSDRQLGIVRDHLEGCNVRRSGQARANPEASPPVDGQQ